MFERENAKARWTFAVAVSGRPSVNITAFLDLRADELEFETIYSIGQLAHQVRN